MTQAIRIAKADVEIFLATTGLPFAVIPTNGATELVYRLTLTGLVDILFYSSLQPGTNLTRATGKDAMRLVPIDRKTGKPLMHAQRRVHRVVGWKKNLARRLQRIRATPFTACPECGATMVPRFNRTTGAEFLGCINFVNHKTGAAPERPPLATWQVAAEPSKGSAVVREEPPGTPRGTTLQPRQGMTVRHVPADQTHGAPVSAFTAAAFNDIKAFNPIQAAVLDVVSQDVNLVLASQTNTGKTKIAEMAIAAALATGHRPAIYTSPLKALSQEKYDRWREPQHPFHRYNISIVTGDYRLTESRKKELAAADLIIMTSEMLDSRCRNIASERNDFLTKAGALVIDELHLLGMADRGDKLEAGLLRFTTINPRARLVCLSATLPNMEQLAEWVRTLNTKPTMLVTSPWRAVPLQMHFRYYEPVKRDYGATQERLLHGVLQTLAEFPQDKVIVFVHAKTMGRALVGALADHGITAEFHNADLELGDRLTVAQAFLNKDGPLRVVVATSTLAWGVNLPARRVIVAGVYRGLDDVSELDLLQMCGRAGRMGLDSAGDAYIMIPSDERTRHEDRIRHPGPILSSLRHPVVLKFHIISEIANRTCRTSTDILTWYQRTLAKHQGYALDADGMHEIIHGLLDDKAIAYDPDQPGHFMATELGKCANYFYLDPSDLHDYVINWRSVFALPDQPTDVDQAWALSHLRSYAQWIISKREIEAVQPYDATFLDRPWALSLPQMKAYVCYLNMLKGTKVDVLTSTHRGLYTDTERVVMALQYLDGRFAHFGREDLWKALHIRLKYGVPENLVPLCRMKGVGKAYALRLYAAGIKTPGDFFHRTVLAKTAIGDGPFKKIFGLNFSEHGEMIMPQMEGG